jgi:hypothetical protein
VKEITNPISDWPVIDTPDSGDLLVTPVVSGSLFAVGDLVDIDSLCREFSADALAHSQTPVMSARTLRAILQDDPAIQFLYLDTRRSYRMVVHFRACKALASGVDKFGKPAHYSTSD